MESSRIYEREAEFFQALGHPIRLKLLDFLKEGPRCACEIEPKFNLDQSTISRHLIILKRAGIVEARKEGVKVIYELKDERVLEIRSILSDMLAKRAREEMELLQAR